MRPFFSPLFFLCLGSLSVFGQLRVVDYNTAAQVRAGMAEILVSIGAESVNGITKAPDILTLEEQNSYSTTTQQIVDVLNGIFGVGTYTQATLDGGTNGAGRPGLIYNTRTVTLLAQTTASTLSGTGAARQTARYQLQPAGYDSSASFYVYVSHYKANNDGPSAARRNVEAQQVRANADALGDAHILYTGDFNVYNSSEAMFQTLLGAGSGQAFDPVNQVGNWHDNAAFLSVHTQSPASTSRFAGQVTGGMDDRFDFQLASAEFLDGEGLSYIGGSYHAFGNTGTHTLNGDITGGSVAALQQRLPGYTAERVSQLLEALASTSDHLPVVADYQVPAKMGVQTGATPLRVIRDASVSFEVTVSNTANVVAALGADELDYTLGASGALSGTASGIDVALGGGNPHSISLLTGTVGDLTGQLEVHSSSQGAANKDFSQAISFTVLDHAKPLFGGQGDATTLTLDFGNVAPGSSSAPQTFSLANWLSLSGSAAALDLDQIVTQGQTSAFTLTLATFANLLSGGAQDFSAAFSPSQTGSFNAGYDLLFSDENLPGAMAVRTLHLDLVGMAEPIPEPRITVFMIVGGLFLLRRWRLTFR